MAVLTYIIGALTSLSCAVLLLRGLRAGETEIAAVERPVFRRIDDFESAHFRGPGDRARGKPLYGAARYGSVSHGLLLYGLIWESD